MLPKQAAWNLPPSAAVESCGISIPQPGTGPVRRVGFGDRFGVKLAVLWAEERGLPTGLDDSKHFK